ncbi:DUF58 domain-containing protein [Calditerrivibrio sp.]|uniref:Uncharacterized protein n=1 Tax=Calditerrivibrio nitroreducens TaxID=477976 RepID=A0A2J6WRG3_9BACT|nr:MAG: hypothetical protein C0187_00475 [Calditerrivibrio nitroreducens]
MGIRFTKAGVIYIILTIFMGFSAINTNNNLVFLVVSFMLAIMGISGFLGKANIEKLNVRIHPVEDPFAKRGSRFILEIKNGKRYLPSILLKTNLRDREITFIILKPLSSIRQETILKFDRRGRILLDDVMVSSPFPFNFFVRYKKYHINEEIIVFPEIGEKSFFNFNRNAEENTTSTNDKITMKLEELSNIRSYSNDPAKRIFWKQFAKTGELYTKEYTGEDSESFRLYFEDILKLYPLEEAIKIATKTVLEAYNNSIPLTFTISNETYNVKTDADKRSVLKRLALYDA